MAKPILDDELWKLIEPIIPKKPRRFRYPGRKSIPNRAALTGILFVLKTGIGWEHLPKEMGCGSGMTCWRRLRDWQKAGVWDKIHHVLLNKLRKAGKIELKAERAEEAKKVVPVVDQKKIKEMVDKVLAEWPRPELGPSDFRVFWKEGLRFETQDGDFKLKIGGRIYHDWGWMRQDSDVKSSKGDLLDGTEFRSAHMYMSGLIYGNIDYKVQVDFAGEEEKSETATVDGTEVTVTHIDKRPVFKDVYLGIRDLPFGYLKMGHFKEPFGLEELTSSRFTTFMERGLSNAFVPGRNTGVTLSSTAFNNRATWATGIFRETGNTGLDKSEGGYNISGRLTVLPWYKDKGANLLHLGIAYSHRDPKDTITFKQKPEAHLAPDFVTTGSLLSDRSELLGLESAWVNGPFSLQGEYIYADVDGKDAGSGPNFDGFYVQGSYFLTGEHRNYKTSTGAFDRIRPKENFTSKGGSGAWEVAARYSQIDLNDGSLRGRKIEGYHSRTQLVPQPQHANNVELYPVRAGWCRQCESIPHAIPGRFLRMGVRITCLLPV